MSTDIISVYHGRVGLGTIREDDAGEFVALDLNDVRVGRYRTRSEALAAIPAPQAATGVPARRIVHDGGPAPLGLFHGLGR